MNQTQISNWLTLLTAALQLAPLAIETVSGIKTLLSRDPAIPEALRAILDETAADNAATIEAIRIWRLAHPVVT